MKDNVSVVGIIPESSLQGYILFAELEYIPSHACLTAIY